MTTETLSSATEPTASQNADAAQPSVADTGTPASTDAAQQDAGERAAKEQEQAESKPEKTAEERRLSQLQRAVDRRTARLARAEAENAHLREQLGLTRPREGASNTGTDEEPISLTRAEFEERVKAEARKLAPTIQEQAAEAERRQGLVKTLEKAWGAEKFDELSSSLDDVFGGLTLADGRAKPATEAIFEADDPARVIEWMTDPDNADEAERISKLGPVQAGKAIAKLEAGLAKEAAKPKADVSKAPAPLGAIPARGTVSTVPDPSDTKAYIKWANEQERKGK